MAFFHLAKTYVESNGHRCHSLDRARPSLNVDEQRCSMTTCPCTEFARPVDEDRDAWQQTRRDETLDRTGENETVLQTCSQEDDMVKCRFIVGRERLSSDSVLRSNESIAIYAQMINCCLSLFLA